MQKIAKEQRRHVRQKLRSWRVAIAERCPERLQRTLGPAVNYAFL